jgi:hypothetical protein
VIRSIKQKFNRFLWNGNEVCFAKEKVSWDLICVPKREGGLGLKRLEEWNRAVILKHIWNLFTKSGSLWVAWININLIKERCSWLLLGVEERSLKSIRMPRLHPSGWSLGIRMVFSLISTDIELSMMLGVKLMPNCLVLLEEGNGIGCRLGMIVWFPFKLNCLL